MCLLQATSLDYSLAWPAMVTKLSRLWSAEGLHWLTWFHGHLWLFLIRIFSHCLQQREKANVLGLWAGSPPVFSRLFSLFFFLIVLRCCTKLVPFQWRKKGIASNGNLAGIVNYLSLVEPLYCVSLVVCLPSKEHWDACSVTFDM